MITFGLPGALRVIPSLPPDDRQSRLTDMLCEEVGPGPIRVGSAHCRMGSSAVHPELFVVGWDSIVVFRCHGHGLRYVTHCSTNERQVLQTPQQSDTDDVVKVVCLPGKGACGVGLIWGDEYLVAWHTGPRNPADLTTGRWLDTIQRAQHDNVASTSRRICALAAWCPAAEDNSEDIADALVRAVRDVRRVYLYCEDRPVAKGYRTFDPRRFQQRPHSYNGKVVQPWLVRYTDPKPHDSLDVFLNPKGEDLSSGRPPLLWLRSVRTERPVDTPVDPKTPGQSWYAIDLQNPRTPCNNVTAH